MRYPGACGFEAGNGSRALWGMANNLPLALIEREAS